MTPTARHYRDLTIVGIVAYGEKLGATEALGLILAVASLEFLPRFG